MREQGVFHTSFLWERDRLHRICQEISVGLVDSFFPEVWYSLVLGKGELHRKETPIFANTRNSDLF